MPRPASPTWAAPRATCSSSSPTCTATAASAPSRASPRRPLGSINLFLTALEDALLAAQNVVVAAESMGLGIVYLGSILADPRSVVKTLELPELTFPVVGLLVGHPDQDPGQKPRMPRSVMSAKNTYPRVESYTETLADYDREVTEYYDLRSGSRLESFTHLVATKIGVAGAHISPIMEVLNEQGLCLR